MIPIVIMLIIMAFVMSIMIMEKEKTITPEDRAKIQAKKAETKQKETDDKVTALQKQLNDLMQIVTLQGDLSESEATFDNTIDHLCHRCIAIKMGKFDAEDQAKFMELKDKSAGYDKTRPMNFKTAIRQLFIKSIHCKAPNCSFTKGDDFLIDEYREIRENLEGNTLLQMKKKQITRFVPLGTPQ